MSISRESVLGIFESKPGQAFRLSAIVEKARAGKHQRAALLKILGGLRKEKRIALLADKRYQLAHRSSAEVGAAAGLIVGQLAVNPRGFGFVRREDAEKDGASGRDLPDIYVAHERMADALHGDRVVARLVDGCDPRRPEGRIVSVVQRGIKQVVGRFHRIGRRGGVVVPRNQRLGRNVYIMAPPALEELPDASWVQVRLTEYTAPPDDLIGEIVEVLGDDQSQGIDILLVLRDYGITEEFPHEVEKEVAHLPDDTAPADLEGRRDLRALMAFTIDGYDAKDFDDAISVEARPSGGYRLYVHIADVSHYVKPHTALDAEALRRSTSIYPVDRVVPMLPEALSNNLCSLVPNKDRLTVTVEMNLSQSGRVEDTEIFTSVIQSRYRLNYRDLQCYYDGIENPATRRLEKISGELKTLLELMEILRDNRIKRGALDLDLPEVEIEFDEAGVIENVVRAPRWKSHQIVEECMILANEAVATHLTEAKVPLLYRIHDQPLKDDIDRVGALLSNYGIHLSSRSKKPLHEQIQDALAAASRFQAPHIFNRLILRSLAQARYDASNFGHFGLASRCYTHFTSPIRRYPDLLTHRALKRTLGEGKPDKEWIEKWRETIAPLGAHCSDLERNADAIEEEATRICALEFMRRHLGEPFHGNVAGMTSFGLFVELRKYPVDGLLHVRDLHGDRYEFNEATMTLRGRRSGHTFRMGEELEVIVHRVDVLNQEMDLRLALLEEMHPRRGGKLYQSRRRRAW